MTGLMFLAGVILLAWGLHQPRRMGPREFMATCGSVWATSPRRDLAVERCRRKLKPGAYMIDVWDVPAGATVAENGTIVYEAPPGWSWAEAQVVMSPRKVGQEEVLRR